MSLLLEALEALENISDFSALELKALEDALETVDSGFRGVIRCGVARAAVEASDGEPVRMAAEVAMALEFLRRNSGLDVELVERYRRLMEGLADSGLGRTPGSA